MNYLTVAGHLGADPEVRFTSDGKKVTTMRLATRCRRGNTDETIWWRVTLWGEQYDRMIPYFKKGSPIVVIGELQKPKIFTDRNGSSQISLDITAHNIQFSPFGKPEKQDDTHPNPVQSSPNFDHSSSEMSGVQMGKSSFPVGEMNDDEVPF